MTAISATQLVTSPLAGDVSKTSMVRVDVLAPLAYGSDRAVTPMIAVDSL